MPNFRPTQAYLSHFTRNSADTLISNFAMTDGVSTPHRGRRDIDGIIHSLESIGRGIDAPPDRGPTASRYELRCSAGRNARMGNVKCAHLNGRYRWAQPVEGCRHPVLHTLCW